MPTTLRLTKEEQRLIREKSIEINKLLINNDKAPMQESELIHEILEKSIRYAKINKDGDLIIDK